MAAVDTHRVLAADAAAQAAGIRPGMTLSAAYAIAPDLDARRRDPEREAEVLRAAALWACQFTPSVAIEPGGAATPAGLVLEVAGSLKLFGGLDRIVDGLTHGMQALGLAASIASAPTARGAWWLARAGIREHPATARALRAFLDRLPIETLDLDAKTHAMLDAIGMRTLGEVLGLPRDGFARRFGPPLLAALDEATGMRPESRTFFVPPERFFAKLELPAIVEDAQALVFAFRRLFIALEGFLRARNGAAQRLDLLLRHEDRDDTAITLGLVAPAHSAEHFTLLARERFTRVSLAAPVRAIALTASDLVSFKQETLTLFRDGPSSARPQDWAQLVERLRARLGNQAVHGVRMVADHRPEYVVEHCDPGAAGRIGSANPHFGPRPLWLLEAPRPLAEVDGQPWLRPSVQDRAGHLVLLAGPERIEAGWWDGDDVTRDYFVARTPDQALVWVYRDRRPPGGWFLHGLFG